MNDEQPFTFVYFDAPTRGEQIRLLFHYSQTPFTDQRIAPFPKGLYALKHSVLGDASPLAFGQCPAVIHGKVTIVQTAACMAYVGSQTGLAPTDPGEHARALMVTLGSEEMRNQVFYACIPVLIFDTLGHGFPGVVKGPINRLLRWVFRKKNGGRFHQWCARFETLLRKNASQTGTFFVGEQRSFADVAVFECLSAIGDTGCFHVQEHGDKYPRLKALMKEIKEVESIRRYLVERGPVGFRGSVKTLTSGKTHAVEQQFAGPKSAGL